MERDLDLPPLALVEQRAGPEIADPAVAQLGRGEGDRSAGNRRCRRRAAPGGRRGRRDIAQKLHRAAALFGETIAAQPHELYLGARARAGEVGDKHRRPLEQADHDEIVRDHAHDLYG